MAPRRPNNYTCVAQVKFNKNIAIGDSAVRDSSEFYLLLILLLLMIKEVLTL